MCSDITSDDSGFPTRVVIPPAFWRGFPGLSKSDLLSLPLSDLLFRLDVTVSVVPSGDGFVGEASRDEDGRIALSLPSGQSAGERDAICRWLLGEVLGLGVSPLPAPLVATSVAGP